MRLFSRDRNVRALIWFLAALFLFLVMGAAFSVSRQRAQLLSEEKAHMQRELSLLGAVMTEDLLRQDYVAIRQYLMAFGSRFPDVYQIKVITPDGLVQAGYMRATEAAKPFKRTSCIDYGDRQCVTLELTYDLGPIQKNLAALTANYIAASLLFAAAMGSLLWYVLRKTAFLPLERALAELSGANARLEERVEERTAEWMRVNAELMNEIEEREAAERNLMIKDQAISTSVNGIAFMDFDGNLTYVNNAFLSLWGYDRQDEVLGRSVLEFWHSPATAAGAVIQALYEKGVWLGELSAKRQNGAVFDVQLSADVVSDGDGRPLCMMASFIDVSERKRAEQLLLESESKFKSFADQAIVGIYLIQDGRIKYCNPRFAGMFGYAPGAFPPDADFRQFIHPDDLPAVEERLAKRLKNEIPSSHYRFRGIKRSGEAIFVEVYGTTVQYEERPAAIGTILDVTDKTLAECALRKSEAMHRMVVENVNEILYMISLTRDPVRGKVEFLGGQVAPILGFQAADFMSDPLLWSGLIHPDDVAAVGESMERMIRTREVTTRLYRVRHKTTMDYLWVEDKAVPQLDDGGNITGYFGVARDVTRRKQAEDALKDALERAEEEKNKSAAIIAAIGDGISIQDTDYRILYQNDIHKKIIGDHVGDYCYRAYQQRDGICEGCAVVLSFADGKIHTVERSAVTDNGPVHVETIASPLRDAAGEIVASIEVVRNITDRKKVEEERERLIRKTQDALEVVSRSRLEWQETFDSITDMIAIHDGDGRIIKANRAFARQFNLTPKDAIGRKCHEFLRGGDPLITECPHKRMLDAGGPVTEELTDTVSGRIFLVATFPYASSGAHAGGVIHITRDISDSKEKEMRLIMSERLAALGQMASGIAHEINNPLASIAGCVDGLGRRINRGQFEPDVFKKYLGIIKAELERSKSITTSMLSIVRKSAYEKRKVNVHETLEKSLEIIGYQGRLKRVEVKKVFTHGAPEVYGSEGELRQVFLIIVTNALDAMGDKGVLGLETAVEDGMLSIAVSDTGPGIAPENITKIFDPFFTTKSERGGTGLGLSIANRIIAAHGGTIRALTESKSGTTFKISLPL